MVESVSETFNFTVIPGQQVSAALTINGAFIERNPVNFFFSALSDNNPDLESFLAILSVLVTVTGSIAVVVTFALYPGVLNAFSLAGMLKNMVSGHAKNGVLTTVCTVENDINTNAHSPGKPLPIKLATGFKDGDRETELPLSNPTLKYGNMGSFLSGSNVGAIVMDLNFPLAISLAPYIDSLSSAINYLISLITSITSTVIALAIASFFYLILTPIALIVTIVLLITGIQNDIGYIDIKCWYAGIPTTTVNDKYVDKSNLDRSYDDSATQIPLNDAPHKFSSNITLNHYFKAPPLPGSYVYTVKSSAIQSPYSKISIMSAGLGVCFAILSAVLLIIMKGPNIPVAILVKLLLMSLQETVAAAFFQETPKPFYEFIMTINLLVVPGSVSVKMAFSGSLCTGDLLSITVVPPSGLVNFSTPFTCKWYQSNYEVDISSISFGDHTNHSFYAKLLNSSGTTLLTEVFTEYPNAAGNNPSSPIFNYSKIAEESDSGYYYFVITSAEGMPYTGTLTTSPTASPELISVGSNAIPFLSLVAKLPSLVTTGGVTSSAYTPITTNTRIISGARMAITANLNSTIVFAAEGPYTYLWNCPYADKGASDNINSSTTCSITTTNLFVGFSFYFKLGNSFTYTLTILDKFFIPIAKNSIAVRVDLLIQSPAFSTAHLLINSSSNLELSFSTTGGGVDSSHYTYQWYSNTSNNTSSGSPINGATNPTYSALPSNSAGSTWYYIKITDNTPGYTSQTATSATIKITTINPLSVSISPSSTTCQGNSFPTLTATAQGGTGTYTYQWYSNLESVNDYTSSSPTPLSQWYQNATKIPNATSAIFSGATISAPTSYGVVIIGDNYIVTSDIVTIYPSPTIKTQPNGFTICQGTTDQSLTVAANEAGVTYQWYSNSTSSTSGGTSVPSATGSSYTPNSNTIGDKYYYAGVTLSGCTTFSRIEKVTISPTPTIASHPLSPSICSGFQSTLTVAATGSNLGYQWQSSPDGINNWANVTSGYNGTTATFTTPNLSVSTPGTNSSYYYRAKTTLGNCFVISNAATVTVLAPPVITTQPSNISICSGGTTALSVTATGIGTVTYQWQQLINNAWTNISNATSASYTTLALTTATQYRVIVSANGCSINSQSGTVSINTYPTISSQPTNKSICSGSSTRLSVDGRGNGAITYQWNSSADNSAWTLIPNATNNYYDTPVINLNAGATAQITYYQAVVTTNTCSTTSQSATVAVNAAPIISIHPESTTICAGATTTLNVIATQIGADALTYQWQSSDNGTSNWSNIDAAILLSYATQTLYNNKYYRVIVYNNGCSSTSNPALVTVNEALRISSNPSSITICSGTSTTLNITATGTGVTYQWQSSSDGLTNWTSVSGGSGATTASYTTDSLTTTTYYRVFLHTAVCGDAHSGIAKITVTNTPNITPINDINICANSGDLNMNVTATVSGSEVLTYQWYQNSTNSTTGGVALTDARTQSDISAPNFETPDNYYFYVIVKSNDMCATASNVCTVTVTAQPDFSINSPTSVIICSGETTTLSVKTEGHSASGVINYQWQSSTDNSTWINETNSGNAGSGNDGGDINIQYTTPALTSDRYYRAQLNYGACVINSSSALVTITTAPAITTQPQATSLCSGHSTTLSIVATTNGTGNLSYQWQSSTNGSTGWSNISGVSSDSYTTPNLTQSIYYQVVVTTEDSCNLLTASDSVLITINPLPIVNIVGSTVGCFGSDITLTVDNLACAAYQWKLNDTNIGTGITYSITNASALNAGTYTVTVTDSNGCINTSPAFNLIITTPPVIDVETLYDCDGVIGYILSASTGDTTPYTWAVAGGLLPPGLSLDTNGTLSGNPLYPGTFNFNVAATYNNGCSLKSDPISMTVTSSNCSTPMIITIPTTLTGTVGTNYNDTFSVSGGTAPYNWFFLTKNFWDNWTIPDFTSPPPGLSIDSSTGVLSGTPTTAGIYKFIVQVIDVNSCLAGTSQLVSMVISKNGKLPVTITLPTNLTGAIGAAYNGIFAATGGTAPYTWATTDTLPSGLVLASNGTLHGTPNIAGTFSFTITATDNNSYTGISSISIIISSENCPSITITPPTLLNISSGSNYSGTFGANAYITYKWSLNSATVGTEPNYLINTPFDNNLGTYTLNTTDFNQCIGVKQITISSDPFVTITGNNDAEIAQNILTEIYINRGTNIKINATIGINFYSDQQNNILTGGANNQTLANAFSQITGLDVSSITWDNPPGGGSGSFSSSNLQNLELLKIGNTLGVKAFSSCQFNNLKCLDVSQTTTWTLSDEFSPINASFQNSQFPSLTKLTLGATVGSFAFSSCTFTLLESLNISVITNWESLLFSSSQFPILRTLTLGTAIGYGAFLGASFSDLEELDISRITTWNVSSLNESSAFSGCIFSKLNNLKLGQTISSNAFNGSTFTLLKSLDVSSIKNWPVDSLENKNSAFSAIKCPNLTTLNLGNVVGSNAFSNASFDLLSTLDTSEVYTWNTNNKGTSNAFENIEFFSLENLALGNIIGSETFKNVTFTSLVSLDLSRVITWDKSTNPNDQSNAFNSSKFPILTKLQLGSSIGSYAFKRSEFNLLDTLDTSAVTKWETNTFENGSFPKLTILKIGKTIGANAFYSSSLGLLISLDVSLTVNWSSGSDSANGAFSQINFSALTTLTLGTTIGSRAFSNGQFPLLSNLDISLVTTWNESQNKNYGFAFSTFNADPLTLTTGISIGSYCFYESNLTYLKILDLSDISNWNGGEFQNVFTLPITQLIFGAPNPPINSNLFQGSFADTDLSTITCIINESDYTVTINKGTHNSPNNITVQSNDCWGTCATTISVGMTIANQSVNQTSVSVAPDTPVTFTANVSTQDPVTYQWYDSNGYIVAATTHTYSPPTSALGLLSYFVRIVIAGSPCPGQKSIPITINVTPLTIDSDGGNIG